IAWTPAVADGDGDPLSCQIASQPANGDASVAANCSSGSYTPDPGFSGGDSFTYRVSDGKGGNDTGTVSVDVSAANSPPVAIDDSAETTAGTPVTIPVLANDEDIDGDTLSVSAVGVPSSGTAVNNGDGTVTYTPASGFTGQATFTYTAADPAGAS